MTRAWPCAGSFIEAWKDHPWSRRPSAPTRPETGTPEMLREAARLAMEYDVPLLIHIAETADWGRGCPDALWHAVGGGAGGVWCLGGQGAGRPLCAHHARGAGADGQHGWAWPTTRPATSSWPAAWPMWWACWRPGSGGGHWHRRPGQQQRPGHVRGDAPGRPAAQGADRGSQRPSRRGRPWPWPPSKARGRWAWTRSPARWRWASGPISPCWTWTPCTMCPALTFRPTMSTRNWSMRPRPTTCGT